MRSRDQFALRRVGLSPARAGSAVLFVIALGWLGGPASADTLVLRDGSTYEGRITERSSEYVILQVNSGGISATQRFEMKDVISLKESTPEATQLAEQFWRKMAKAQEAGIAPAFAAVGLWAQENKLYENAVVAFQRARELDPSAEARYGFAMAQNMAQANNLRSAHSLLKDLADKYPDNANIAAELARLDQRAQKRVDQMVRPALEKYKAGDIRGAVELMERVQRLDVNDVLDKADYTVMQQTGMPFGKLLAEARLHQPCANCARETQLGLVVCPTCKGLGKVAKTRMEWVTKKDPKTGIEERRTYQVEYQAPCPTCREFTTQLCPACGGAGVELGNVGQVERSATIEGLAKRIEFLNDKLADYAAEPSGLHPINLEVVHLQAARQRYYLAQYAQLNGELAGAELTTLVDRRTAIENLYKHTSLAYRNRKMEDFREALSVRLREQIRRDGILWPEDFDFDAGQSEVSSSLPRPAPRP